MDLDVLRAFVVIAEERSFTRAAEKLHIAQSPLSQQIRRLEREVGVQLLTRTTRSVSLTTAGQVLLERLRPSLLATEKAITAAVQAGRGDLGAVAVGLTASATYRYLPRIMEHFKLYAPEVSLDLRTELFTPAVIDQLRSGSLSAAIVRPPIRADELSVEVLASEPLIVAVPEGHRLTGVAQVNWVDLRDEVFVTYPPEPVSTIHTKIMSACVDAGFFPSARHYVSNSAAMLRMVSCGVGIAVVPDSMRALELDGAVFRPLVGPVVMIELALVHHERITEPAVTRFLAIAREVITADAR
ncbi:LysR substrate-binding domain-containing protein [Nocardia sp. R6R-6]|uniref:LysR substrate-binding domain-containing protein n=1 Tax=Nocardia sp. R6R-6 TaxID=3459303 RepID=UPI00403DB71C